MKAKIYVWDIVIRVFHWALVTAFILSYITGDEESDLHIYSGYTILLLLGCRLIWGFVGSRHARFANFVRPIADAIQYLKSLLAKQTEGTEATERYLGHNPAGGLMVLAFIASLLLTGLSGLMLYGEQGKGPLATAESSRRLLLQNDSAGDSSEHRRDHEESVWHEVHETFVNLDIVLILMHVGGVYLSSRKQKENLVRAMVTGYKDKR